MRAGVAQEPGRSRRLHRRRGTRTAAIQMRPGPGGGPPPRERTGRPVVPPGVKKRGGTGGEKSESADSTGDVGEPAPGDPAEGSGGPGYGAFGGKDGGHIGTGDHLNETTEAGGTGPAGTAVRTDDDRAPHRHGVDARGLPAHAQGRRGGSGRRDGAAVRGRPGGEPCEPAREVQVRPVPCAAGAPCLHPEAGQGGEDEAAGHPDAGGQGSAARGADGAGAGVRGGLPVLLVRVPARTRAAHGAGGAVARADVDGRRLGDRPRHPELLRRGGSGTPEGLSGPTGCATGRSGARSASG